MPELALSAVSDDEAIDELEQSERQPLTTLPPDNYIKQYLQHMLAEPLDLNATDHDTIWQPENLPGETSNNNVSCFDLAPVVETNALYWWSYQGLLSAAERRHLLYRQFLQVLLLSYRLGSKRVRQAAIAECRHIWATFEDTTNDMTQDQDS